MTSNRSDATNTISEINAIFSLSEVCERCGLHAELIAEMVEYGIIAPIESAQPRWQFTATALLRLHRAQRLQRDLELNLPGLALSLELLDEVASLRSEISALKHRLQQLHD
jgi:chaperone modulatory protein CbpM